MIAKYALSHIIQSKQRLINKQKFSTMIDMGSKTQKMLIGISGIYSLYFIGSLIQERIMKYPYQNVVSGDMQLFENSNAFILVPSVLCWVVGTLYNRNMQHRAQVPQKNWFVPAALILLGALAMTKAIYLTNYPIVTLFKSCNLLSVLTIAVFFSRVNDKLQKLGKKKIIVGVIVTFGVLLYHFGKSLEAEQFTGQYLGIGFLLFSVVCDGLVPDFQAEIKTNYKPSPMQMFQHLNKWKTLLAFIYSLQSFQIKYLVVFFWEHPVCLLHMLILSTTGAMGQIVVYWMINHFRQHVVPFIITTRKILTVVLSIIFFKHTVTVWQMLGIVIVLATVFYDFKQQISTVIVKQETQTWPGLSKEQFQNLLIEPKMKQQQIANLKIEEEKPASLI